MLNKNVRLGIIFEIVDQIGAHFRKRGQIFDLAGFQIDPKKMKIFVTLVVLRIDDEAISLPKIFADIAVLF